VSDTQARLDAPGGEVWHVIEGADLRELLRRAYEGEDPELLYIEAYVNAEKGDDDAAWD
jgi:hypothetical protein